MTTAEIARQKYQKALKLIEQAQWLLGDACQELSPLLGAVDQWEQVGAEYDRVHQLWRDLAYSHVRDSVDLDSDTKAAMAKRRDGDTE